MTRYGLDVHVAEISGGSTAVTALIAGDVDLCQIAGASVVSAAVADAEVVIIAGVINQQPRTAKPENVLPTVPTKQSVRRSNHKSTNASWMATGSRQSGDRGMVKTRSGFSGRSQPG